MQLLNELRGHRRSGRSKPHSNKERQKATKENEGNTSREKEKHEGGKKTLKISPESSTSTSLSTKQGKNLSQDFLKKKKTKKRGNP